MDAAVYGDQGGESEPAGEAGEETPSSRVHPAACSLQLAPRL